MKLNCHNIISILTAVANCNNIAIAGYDFPTSDQRELLAMV